MTAWLMPALLLFAGLLHPVAMRASAGVTEAAPASGVIGERTLRLPIVGASTIYVPEGRATSAILFLSGDGGWNKGVVGMARRAARSADAIVAGVSIPTLQKAARTERIPCWCPACDLEEIGKSLEKQAGFQEYLPPTLIGYSSGASLVYAALAGAPPETFQGGMSLGFCPDLEQVPPLCRHADWRPTYDPAKKQVDLPRVRELARPWVVLQGTVDQVCDPAGTEEFAREMKGATLSMLPGVGHGYGNEARWGGAFDEGLKLIAAAPPPAESDAPMVPSSGRAEDASPGEAPGAGAGPASTDRVGEALNRLDLPLILNLVDRPRGYLVFISGDGGWSRIDKILVQRLAERRVSSIGLDTLKYFWNEKKPDRAAADLRRILDSLGPHPPPVFLGGYSFGAEVAPFLCARSEFHEGTFAGMVLMGPGPYASWEVTTLDWLRSKEKPTPHKVLDQINDLGPIPILCLYGEDEDESVCPGLAGKQGRTSTLLGGGHHFNGDYEDVAKEAVGFVLRILDSGDAAPR